MGLTDDDVREILRIIDESELDELRIETPDFRLHVRRAGAPMAEPAPGSALSMVMSKFGAGGGGAG